MLTSIPLCDTWYIVSPGLVFSQATMSPRKRQQTACNAVPTDTLEILWLSWHEA